VLAYVFSHQPAPGAAISAYEDALRRFHTALASSRTRGFVSSVTYRIGDGYSDWYLLEDSAALDPLNEAAVAGSRAAHHDAAASMAAHGVGKLLSLASGSPDAGAFYEVRFSKPAGMVYADLNRTVDRLRSRDAALWRRMMVLGPPPEFYLTCRAPIELPAEMKPEVLERTPI
jgi:hypothetical protein